MDDEVQRKKTLSDWISTTMETKKVLDFISHESKNVFNHYQFCCGIFNDYKRNIYKSLLKKHSSDITQDVLDKLDKYYVIRSTYFNVIKQNNQIIYEYIKNDNLKVYNYNFEALLKQYKFECRFIKDIVQSNKYNDILFNDVIKNILKSMYFRNYYKLKSDMVNHKKPNEFSITDKQFIEHVKSKTMIFDTENYHGLLLEKYKNKNTLKSEQNIIRRFARQTLKECKLPGDMIINIMDKAYSAYSSQQALKAKGIRTGMIKYLPKDGHFTIPFFSHSFLIVKDKIRLSIGETISKRYETITGSKRTKESKFLYINIPNKLLNNENCKIKMIEICPIYDGYRYKQNIVYDETYKPNITITKENEPSNFTSIDIGMKNLMTIYDPISTQKIIRGSFLTTPNQYYNKRIDQEKSKLPKGMYSNDKIKNLTIKRENILNYRMNKIVKELFDSYKHKSKIIVGYNEGWKQNIDMGKKNNRKFYDVPYDRLIKKMEGKFGKDIIVRHQEAYTSKCDALNLEPIKKHDEYDGERIKRGLFSSKTNKIINADLNGAINIMRLYCKDKKIQFTEVKGINIFNPQVLKMEL
jgi:IS605 OrfB family transposase